MGDWSQGNYHYWLQPAALRQGLLKKLSRSCCETHSCSVICLLLLLENSDLLLQNSPRAFHEWPNMEPRGKVAFWEMPGLSFAIQRPQQGVAGMPNSVPSQVPRTLVVAYLKYSCGKIEPLSSDTISPQSSPRLWAVRCYVCRSRGQFVCQLFGKSLSMSGLDNVSLGTPCTGLVGIVLHPGRVGFLHQP